MSFEGVFENWLKGQGTEESGKSTRKSLERQENTRPIVEVERAEDDGYHHQTTHASLTGAANICFKQAGGKILPSKPLPVQVACSPGDEEDKPRRPDNKISDCEGNATPSEVKQHSPTSNKVDCRHWKQTMPAGQDRRLCHTHSPQTDLRDLTPTASPAAAETGRVPPVLTPEHDLPMEPDSTSECLLTGNKSAKPRRKSNVSMRKVYQGTGGSPCPPGKSHCGVQACGVAVNAEENQAECDSTCMFLTSPHAISPASQGEIEERACHFITDHEDGASPAHCVCQCRSLPIANLLPRDHVPTATTATSASPPSLISPNLTVKIISTDSSSCSETSSKSPLTSPPTHYECRATSDLENFVTKLELKRKKVDEKQLSGPVLSGLSDESFHKQCFAGYDTSSSIITPSATTVKKTPPTVIKKQSYLPCERGPTRRALHSQSNKLDVDTKCDTKQRDVCDFAKHIDWDTAVAETLESSTSVTGNNGESKPGIILKIRAKAVVPCLEKNLDTKSMKTAPSAKRKGESLGNPEILSKLRKRVKSEASETSLSEQATSEQHTGQCKIKDQEARSETSGHNSSACRQRRRNTVHVDEDLKTYTKHLSPREMKFVESTLRLSRLQTLTHNLVCSLFPTLRQQLSHVTPESNSFSQTVDDIITCLECSDSEESLKEFEFLSEQFEGLQVKEAELVPVYSPQVMLCGNPLHSLEDFQHKVCNLLQLLLPDLTVSLSERFLQSPAHLEGVVRQVLQANKIKDRSARKCRLFSV